MLAIGNGKVPLQYFLLQSILVRTIIVGFYYILVDGAGLKVTVIKMFIFPITGVGMIHHIAFSRFCALSTS